MAANASQQTLSLVGFSNGMASSCISMLLIYDACLV
jgi:hypothetical protein